MCAMRVKHHTPRAPLINSGAHLHEREQRARLKPPYLLTGVFPSAAALEPPISRLFMH